MTDRKTLHFVEGQCEEALLRSLILDFGLLPSGRIKVLNICQRKFPKSLIFSLKPGSRLIFIFDTDAGNPSFVEESLKMVENMTSGVELIVVPQCRNLEDDLMHSCSLREIKQLTKSRSNKDFKSDFLGSCSIGRLLRMNGFDFSKLWTKELPAQWQKLRKGDLKHFRGHV